MQELKMLKNFMDCNDSETFAIEVGVVNALVLTANVAKFCPIPIGAKYVIMNGNCGFWAKVDDVAIIPAADILDGTSPEYVPAARIIEGAHSISVISPVDGIVQLSFYK